MLLMFMCLMMESPKVMLDTTMKYQSIKADSEAQLQMPFDMSLDDQGRLYVVDVAAMAIFVWDKDGKHINTIGKKGKGPGEFDFVAQYGGGQGYISIVKDKIYVFDGGSKFLSTFDMNHKFVKRIPYIVETGKVEGMRIMNDKNMVIYNVSFFAETPNRKTAIFNFHRDMISELMMVKDESWYYTDDQKAGVMNGYSHHMSMAYNELTGEIIVGDTSKNQFKIFDQDGKPVETVSFKIKRQPIEDAHKKEYKEHPNFKNQNFFKAKFPDYKSNYDRIIPVGKDRFLVTLESPLYRDYQGILIDRKGNTLGEMTYKCGEGGRIFGSHGRIFAVQTTREDGEFEILELQVK